MFRKLLQSLSNYHLYFLGFVRVSSSWTTRIRNDLTDLNKLNNETYFFEDFQTKLMLSVNFVTAYVSLSTKKLKSKKFSYESVQRNWKPVAVSMLMVLGMVGGVLISIFAFQTELKESKVNIIVLYNDWAGITNQRGYYDSYEWAEAPPVLISADFKQRPTELDQFKNNGYTPFRLECEHCQPCYLTYKNEFYVMSRKDVFRLNKCAMNVVGFLPFT